VHTRHANLLILKFHFDGVSLRHSWFFHLHGHNPQQSRQHCNLYSVHRHPFEGSISAAVASRNHFAIAAPW
jgi:hypothetical protein